MIKNMTLAEYEAQTRNIVSDVMSNGDIVHVDTGETGKFFVVRDEKLGDLIAEVLQQCRDNSKKMLGL